MYTFPCTSRISRPSTMTGGAGGVSGTVVTGCCACATSRPIEYNAAAMRAPSRMSACCRCRRWRLRQQLFDFQFVFGIDGGLAALRGLERDPVLLGVAVLFRPPRVVRHIPDRMAGHFIDNLEKPSLIDRDVRAADPMRRADKWLLEVHGVVHNGHQRELIAMPDEVLGHRRLGTGGNTVSLDDAVLHMGGRDGQAIAFDLSGRKPFPQVLGIW